LHSSKNRYYTFNVLLNGKISKDKFHE